ncbi:MAG: hypothetical protein KQH63_05655 [Desulfobulbaceae bacterium]|nr:hypothetical protein [Desulfobulbaceae bacterium]
MGIVSAFNAMGYDAVGISRLDLAAGVDFLLEQKERSHFPWLSANLVNSETGKPLFDPYIIIKKSGLRIAVIGITGLEEHAALPGTTRVTTLSWKKILLPLVNELRSKSDLVVLLSSLSPGDNQEISNQFPTLHILIQSGGRPRNIIPRLINNTLVCQTDRQGKYLGKLSVHWQESGQWQEPDNNQLLVKKQEYDRITWQLKRLRKKGDPEIIYQDRPANLKAYRNLKARYEELENEIHTLQAQNRNQSDKATFENTFLELAPEVADDTRLAAITQDTKKKINAIGRNKKTMEMLPGYAGSAVCALCHKDIADKWSTTGHAHAYQTLALKKQHFNSNCLPCHVTGISMQNKNDSLSLHKLLYNVGCESCHGPGKKHAETPEKTGINAEPDASVCLQCHIPEHDDGFDFELDRMKIH